MDCERSVADIKKSITYEKLVVLFFRHEIFYRDKDTNRISKMTRHTMRFASLSTIFALAGTILAFSACGRIGRDMRDMVEADTRKSELLGPVKAVRSETAMLVDGMGNPAEEQRGLAEESNYDPSGFETERSLYSPDGLLLSRTTFGYGGRRIKSEALLHDPKGVIREKKIFKADEGGNIVGWQNTRPDG
ncbi:MAG TPA: hypothetical protein VNH22_20880, partial [Blastocatellia bacterium]|nr:hypothetical protein [Blastocatellia bacterium]